MSIKPTIQDLKREENKNSKKSPQDSSKKRKENNNLFAKPNVFTSTKMIK